MTSTTQKTTKKKLPLNLEWSKKLHKFLKGKTIKGARYMNKEEADGWYKVPLIIEFTDGTMMIPMQDDEGNDGGALDFYHPEKELEESGAPTLRITDL
tara:strand:+ start:81 stop:374 length:294 start_codon:yes stop_codon:yes gene_type:complete